MSSEREYAEAIWPARWRAFGRNLRSFTLGHALLLRRLDLEGRDWSEILQAVWLCSFPVETAGRIAVRPTASLAGVCPAVTSHCRCRS